MNSINPEHYSLIGLQLEYCNGYDHNFTETWLVAMDDRRGPYNTMRVITQWLAVIEQEKFYMSILEEGFWSRVMAMIGNPSDLNEQDFFSILEYMIDCMNEVSSKVYRSGGASIHFNYKKFSNAYNTLQHV